jgi:hypothetical protein
VYVAGLCTAKTGQVMAAQVMEETGLEERILNKLSEQAQAAQEQLQETRQLRELEQQRLQETIRLKELELQNLEKTGELRELEQQRIAEEGKRQAVTRRQVANQEQVLERYAHLGEQVDGQARQIDQLLRQVASVLSLKEIIQEWLEELSDRVEEVAHRQGLILELQRLNMAGRGNGQKAKIETLLRKIDHEPEIVSLKRQASLLRRQRDKLLEKRAIQGVDTSPGLLIQIEEIETEIEQIQKSLIVLSEID